MSFFDTVGNMLKTASSLSPAGSSSLRSAAENSDLNCPGVYKVYKSTNN